MGALKFSFFSWTITLPIQKETPSGAILEMVSNSLLRTCVKPTSVTGWNRLRPGVSKICYKISHRLVKIVANLQPYPETIKYRRENEHKQMNSIPVPDDTSNHNCLTKIQSR